MTEGLKVEIVSTDFRRVRRLQGAPTGASAVTSEAQALVNLTDTNALSGMSSTEKSEVINFNVPQ